MKIQRVIETVNQMHQAGVIANYAIGGAVAATFYLEPAATLDVDVFVTFQPAATSSLLTISPIMEYLHGQGCTLEGEYVIIAGWPVQFLPPTGPLVEEALVQAVSVDVEHTPARVFTAEHLAAIALQLGRAKDYMRLLQFVQSGVLDPERFQAILERHNLADAWNKFESRFLTDPR